MPNQETATQTAPLDSWPHRARLLRVMSHPVRLSILEKLCQRPHCVKHLNALIDISQPQLSQHMAALRREKLVACHACGPVRCYYIARPTLVKAIVALLQKEHPLVEMDCQAIIAQARQGWEEDMPAGSCPEEDVLSRTPPRQ